MILMRKISNMIAILLEKLLSKRPLRWGIISAVRIKQRGMSYRKKWMYLQSAICYFKTALRNKQLAKLLQKVAVAS